MRFFQNFEIFSDFLRFGCQWKGICARYLYFHTHTQCRENSSARVILHVLVELAYAAEQLYNRYCSNKHTDTLRRWHVVVLVSWSTKYALPVLSAFCFHPAGRWCDSVLGPSRGARGRAKTVGDWEMVRLASAGMAACWREVFGLQSCQ